MLRKTYFFAIDEEGKGGKYMEKEIIFFVEKKNREGKGGKYSEKEKNDGQIDTQTEFSCVDSTPSVVCGRGRAK